MTFNKKTIFKISPNIVFKKIEDSFILLEINGDKMFELDDVSAAVWNGITEHKSVKEILASVADEYELTFDDEAEIEKFIKELIDAKIISE